VAEIAAIVLAAGQGKRMRSSLPKVLHRVAGRTMIEHVLRSIQAADIRRIVVVVGHGGELVRAALPAGVKAVEQREQLGTAHATSCGVAALADGERGDMIVCYGDCPLLTAQIFRDLIEARRKDEAAIALAASRVEDPGGYGRVVVDAEGRVRFIVEEAVATADERRIKLINAGVYCFDGGWLAQTVPLVKPSKTGEYYLTDLIALANDAGRAVQAVEAAYELTSGVNDRVQLAEAERVARDRVRQRLMLAGVTMVDPPSTYVDDDVDVGPDTTIYPGTILEGSTRIGSGCRIGPRAHIVDSSIGDGVVVDAAVVERSEILNGARIGPFCHLRSGARLLERADLGNYAEVKNATIGVGTKMHHFSYVGDAEIGDDVNIGAGTITCNYDSETGRKSQTIIEREVGLGCDTMLVAPVRIGEGAITAAGSVVIRDVEPGTLVVGVPARPIRPRRRRAEPSQGG
jgi:bifunctional UDP-N-acetylglucosamine pyrophosphorylase/glucosamine-1-phosphate N-acetyltransferase